MIEKQIRPSRQLGYTQLYLDFLAGDRPARSFYSAQTIAETCLALDKTEFSRREIVDILHRQNESYHSAPAALAAIDKLLDPRSVCIFGGQQAGLFGGPMMTLLKALAIAKAAPKLSEQLRRPVVPIFWIAADDHDFEEVNHTFLLDRQGGLQRIEYTTRPMVPSSLGQVRLSDHDQLEKAVAQFAGALGQTEFTADVLDLLRKCYSSKETFVTAFGKLMAALTAEYGLVLFSPHDSAAKALARPFFRGLIEQQDLLHAVLSERNRAIQSAGYHLQVQKQEDAADLFVDLDGRKPVHRKGESFTVGDRTFTARQMLDLLEAEPERFSPDALTRPLFQACLFPTAVQMGGPSEIAYFAQGNVIFDLFKRQLPVHIARPTIMFAEKRHARLMDEYAIEFEEVAGDIEQLINRILLKSFPVDIENRYHQLKSEVRRQFDTFTEESLHFDPSLREFAGQTFGKIDFALKTFEGKLFAAHKKKSADTRERIYRLRTALYPDGAFQDRALNAANFIARYGSLFVSWLYQSVDPFAPGPKMISLSEE
ncbi:bacillithiol biosynthesis cysteine-adding enzyme BshC [candidate division GN15 bacterium]|uniref:Putative cysteine ligase BshC n=1 Tax=candidate division GN15 bacterium TaxID=2072418 RepID=A0A855WUK2_9BACT|nr:MAG: bacillithiol biosynthesis cysteine-adding enzyme BshC [candidate division GN15 bacterium]